tara:strand:- start:1982 stop:3160 length:1179 start_codon:yes stop_codon:yes gene_type:complete
MSEEQKDEVQEEAVEQTQEVQVKAVPEEKPEEQGPKAEVLEDGTFKLDLSQGSKEPEVEAEAEPEVQPEVEAEEKQPGLEEVIEEEQTAVEEVEDKVVEEVQEQVQEAIEEAKETGEPLPENIQKVVDFINETGGSLEDYVKLNQDFTSYDDKTLLLEYYKQTKPHLNNEEINFLMEDQFSFNEDVDEEIDIKRKKLALKEQVASAKGHLDGLKSKYYEEVKAGSKLAPEQQKAVDFFNRYNEELEETNKSQGLQQKVFQEKTKQVFNDQFKGFEYKVGEKKYRFNVKDAAKVKDTQSDINNFVKKFLNEKNEMSDASGYHKSLFTAMNPDLVAQHFYEQGKADAVKSSIAKSKNIDMEPRSTHEKAPSPNGFSVKAVDNSSSDFKFRIKTR